MVQILFLSCKVVKWIDFVFERWAVCLWFIHNFCYYSLRNNWVLHACYRPLLLILSAFLTVVSLISVVLVRSDIWYVLSSYNEMSLYKCKIEIFKGFYISTPQDGHWELLLSVLTDTLDTGGNELKFLIFIILDWKMEHFSDLAMLLSKCEDITSADVPSLLLVRFRFIIFFFDKTFVCDRTNILCKSVSIS